MSETKVCLWLDGQRMTMCGSRMLPDHGAATVDDPFAAWRSFICLPRQAQCDECVRRLHREDYRDWFALAAPENYAAQPKHVVAVECWTVTFGGHVWPKVTHEHRWFPAYRGGRPLVSFYTGEHQRQCTCGLFELPPEVEPDGVDATAYSGAVGYG